MSKYRTEITLSIISDGPIPPGMNLGEIMERVVDGEFAGLERRVVLNSDLEDMPVALDGLGYQPGEHKFDPRPAPGAAIW